MSKNRVVSSTGKKVSNSILDQLDNVLLSFAPSINLKITKLEADVQTLTTDKESLEKKNNDMKEKIKLLEQQLDQASASMSK